MSAQPKPDPQAQSDELDVAADEAIAACNGDLRSAVRALVLVNEFLEWELETKTMEAFVKGVQYGRFHTYSG